MVTPTFKNVSGAKLDLTQIKPLNDQGEEFVSGMGKSCAGGIKIQKLTTSTGKYADLYQYYWPASGTKVGWCDSKGVPVAVGDVTFENGEAMLVANTWKKNTDVYFQCNGEVDLLGQNAVPYNKSLCGNALPRALDLTEIKVLNDSKEEFVSGMGKSCAGGVKIQKLTPSTGKYADLYQYYWPASGTKVGWCDSKGVPVAVGDVTFEPGEAMLVANTWKKNTIVYFDLPDPLTSMPVPEAK